MAQTKRKKPVGKRVNKESKAPESRNLAYYADLSKRAEDALNLYDPQKLKLNTSSVFSKSDLRSYLQDPDRNASNLRKLSRFLRTRSQVYKKIIYDNATMIDTHYRSVIPRIDNTKKKVNQNQVIKSFYETSEILELMNLPSEMLKVYLECWTVDAFFGVYYYFDGEGGVILPLDPDYCQIVGEYPTGDFMFAFNCSYFSSHADELELWGEPFTTMWDAYQKDMMNGKWQIVPDEYAVCMKVNLDNYMTAIPPYISLFDSIINLEDLKEITAVAEEERLYKLLVFQLETLKGAQVPDDFNVDLKTAVKYYNKCVDILPDYTDAILSPLKVEAVTFDQDQASDVNKVENSAKNILKTSGHSVMADPNGTTAVMAALKCDEDYAISALLPQTQGWVNRFLSYKLKNPAKVKFLEVTKYTRDSYKDSLIKDLNYGVPVITTLGVLNGYSEVDMINMAKVNDILGLSEIFKPLATAATRSSEEVKNGRPKKDIPTDESESSETERENTG